MAKKRRVKVRITTWVDRDVLMWLKVRSLETRMGYQTLMNRMLQEAIANAGKPPESPPVDRKEYESMLVSLKELEGRLGELKQAVDETRAQQAERALSRAPSNRNKKPRRPTNKKTKDQRRLSQNSTS